MNGFLLGGLLFGEGRLATEEASRGESHITGRTTRYVLLKLKTPCIKYREMPEEEPLLISDNTCSLLKCVIEMLFSRNLHFEINQHNNLDDGDHH